MLRSPHKHGLALGLLLIVALCLSLFGPTAAFAAPEKGGPPEPVKVQGHDGVLLRDADDARLAPDAPLTALAAAAASGDYQIDSLLSPYRWYVTTVTYSFYKAGSRYDGDETNKAEVSDSINVRQIMAWYGTILNLNFVEIEESDDQVGITRFLLSSGPSYAYAYYPGNSYIWSVAGDVHLNPSYDCVDSANTNCFGNPPGSHGYMSLVHEIGHTLGLKHPHDGSPILPEPEDNTSTTVMTYDFIGPSAGTPMVYDHKALQYLYGARANRTGSDVYAFTSRGADQYSLGGTVYLDTTRRAKQTIWDTGGVNTLDASALPASGGYRFDLNPGGWLTASADYVSSASEVYYVQGTSIGPGVNVRDIVNSTSNDTIYANSQANTFKGYNPGRAIGNDVIYWADSDDTLDLSGYTPSQVSQTRVGNDLELTLGGGKITLKDYYAGRTPTISFGSGGPSLSIDDVTVQGADTSARTARFTVTLSAASTDTITVNYATANGSAVAPADYAAKSDTLTFAPGVTTQTIDIAVAGDTDSEDAETFSVNLSNPSAGVTLAKASGTATIPAHNQAPVAAASANPMSGPAPLRVDFNSTGTNDPDLDDAGGLQYAWSFGTGATATGPSATYTYNNPGTYNATLTVTDPHGANSTITVTISVGQAPTKEVFVSSINLRVVTSGRNKQVIAEVTLKDGSGAAVSGAMVTGRWSGLISGNASGTTNSSGVASLRSKTINKGGTVTFTVTGVTPPSGYAYDRSQNEMESVSITLTAPSR